MAHELTITNGAAEMAFSGETPWHNLGQKLTKGATLQDWTIQAGMNWTAETAPVQFEHNGIMRAVESQKVIYRSDTGAPLSVMGDGYKLVQPRECLSFFQSLLDGGDFRMETAGTMNGGRRFWALARNGHKGDVVKGDKSHLYLMLATSLDGTTPTIASFTAVRVVCANTMAMAMRGLDGSAVRVSHRSKFDHETVKARLGLAGVTWEAYMNQMRGLAEKAISLGEARDVLRPIFGQPVSSRRTAATIEAAATAADAAILAAKGSSAAGVDLAALLAGSHVPKGDDAADARDDLARILAGGDLREQKSVARILALYAGEGRGADHPGVKGTAWGLLNACTEHIDHEQGRTRDAGLSSAWFGKGADLKSQTLDALLAL